jgi:hypothetical protein
MAEGIDISKQSIEEWAKNADGDVRFAITSLQFGTVAGVGKGCFPVMAPHRLPACFIGKWRLVRYLLCYEKETMYYRDGGLRRFGSRISGFLRCLSV